MWFPIPDAVTTRMILEHEKLYVKVAVSPRADRNCWFISTVHRDCSIHGRWLYEMESCHRSVLETFWLPESFSPVLSIENTTLH